MKPKIKIKRIYDRGHNGGNRKLTKKGYARAMRRASSRATSASSAA